MLVLLLTLGIVFVIISIISAFIAGDKDFAGAIISMYVCGIIGIVLVVVVFNMAIGVPKAAHHISFWAIYHVTAVDTSNPDFINVVVVEAGSVQTTLYAFRRSIGVVPKIGERFAVKKNGDTPVIEILE